MAGRGARIHILPEGSKINPNSAWTEVSELERVLKLFPDASEKQRAHAWRANKEAANRKWTLNQQKHYSPVHFGTGQYAGEMVDGKREGYGIYVDQIGNRFQGEWSNNVKEGFFVILYLDGERFEGHFSNDKRNGEGTAFYPNGAKFHGDYKNDVRDGSGMYWTQHEYYDLQKLWLRRYAKGSLVEQSEIYTNEQKDAQKPKLGYGTFVDDLGRRYEGDFVDYKRDGRGKTTYPDGSVDISEWKDDMRQGIGVQQLNGLYYFVTWVDDTEKGRTPTDELNFQNYFWYDEGGNSQLS